MESSTSSTLRPLNSLAMTLSFWRTDFLRTACPGMMKVRPDVAVFHEAFAVGQAQQLGQLGGAGAAGFGDRDDHIDFVRRHGGDHALGQASRPGSSAPGTPNAVHHRVRAGQVHKLEDAGLQRGLLGALLAVQLARAGR